METRPDIIEPDRSDKSSPLRPSYLFRSFPSLALSSAFSSRSSTLQFPENTARNLQVNFTPLRRNASNDNFAGIDAGSIALEFLVDSVSKAQDSASIPQNQDEFAAYINLALRDLCQGKILGDAEMLLFYALRKPSSGDLRSGTIDGHSVHNQVHFGGSRNELELHYGQAWSEFAESVIPRPVIENPLIPRNPDNQPVFPSIDVNNVAIGVLG
ncbi:hypothetical protein B0H13DRAFT_1885854 [Mycena leptocephala]|nr:hypothetical protein B0H13DRAFT_1885854 [Mycena leptocephala]